MKNFLILLFLSLSVKISYSQSQNTPDDIVKVFFETYKKNPEKAVENIYSKSKWASRNLDGISKLKSEVNKLTLDFVGEYYGYSELYKKDLAGCFALQSYIVRYDRQPLRFTFEFYKAKDEWTLYSFDFDSNLDDELEEANKVIYNLKY